MRDNILRKNWTSITTHNGSDLCPATESSCHIILICRLVDAVWERADTQGNARRSTDLTEFLLAPEPPAYGRLWHVVAACVVPLWAASNDQVFHSMKWRTFNEIAQLLRLWGNRAKNEGNKIKLCNFADVFSPPPSPHSV